MKYNIIFRAETNNPKFPAQVSDVFDTPEDLIDAIIKEENEEQLYIWSGAGFAVSSKAVSPGKSLPASWIKTINFDLIKGMEISERSGAKEAAKKLKAAKEAREENVMPEKKDVEKNLVCKKSSCLWICSVSESHDGTCPECGSKMEEL